MAGQDQLELIAPNGEIRFFDLDPVKGITNIGRHPENDIVIDSPEVAQFHAVLDHRQRPYQLVVVSQEARTLIGGAPVLPNVPHVLNSWDTIEMDGHALVLVETGAGASGPARAYAPPMPAAGAAAAMGAAAAAAAPSLPAPAATQPAPAEQPPAAAGMPGVPALRLTSLPPDQTDESILTELSERDWVLDVDQTATCQVTVINGGSLVATFQVRVEGLEPSWVTVAPDQINLFEGERGTFNISFTPPRSTSSRAGTYYLSIVVTSPQYPGRASATSGTLVVNPYWEFTVGDLSPRNQTVTYRKPTGQATLPLSNQSNAEATFRLDAEDDEHGCRFEFTVPGESASLISHAELRLAPDASTVVPIRITSLKRRFLGVGKHTYNYTVTTTMLNGVQTPRAVLAQVQAAPMIGPWVIILLAILLAILIAVIFRPRIQYFGTDPALRQRNLEPIPIQAGESVTLYWQASAFSNLRLVSDLQQDPDQGPLEGTTGSKTVTPPVQVTYRLVAENLLTRLHQQLFQDDAEVTIVVAGVQPNIYFTTTATTIVRGESVTLAWTVERADEVFLLVNGVPETIPPEQYVSSRTFTPEVDTTYSLQARNRYTGPEGVQAPIEINVEEPTPTPVPKPVIQRFDVQPLVITEGETIRLDWLVTGVDNVTIAGVEGVLAPAGSLEVQPAQAGEAFYVLTASNPGGTESLQKKVTVLPAPTATPVPEAPRIEFFTATPLQVVAGDPQASDIKLSWSVVGDVTDVQISGPDFGSVSNLPQQGTISVAAVQSTLFVLTAFNGEDLSTSQTVQITVIPPTPTPTPQPTPLPLPIVIFSAAADVDRGESPDSVVAITTGDVPTNTRRYQVVAGTWVIFNWTATNAVKTVFLGEDKAPVDSRSLQITSAGTFLFSAVNAQNVQTDLFIQIVTIPRPAPPVPFNVNGPNLATTGPMTITWDYDPDFIDQIDNFKIYRAILPGTEFSAIADNVPKTLPLQYVDETGSCDMAYYVVAVYTDLNGVRRETGPSMNSWYSQACPVGTPGP